MRKCVNSPTGECPANNLTDCIKLGKDSPCLQESGNLREKTRN